MIFIRFPVLMPCPNVVTIECVVAWQNLCTKILNARRHLFHFCSWSNDPILWFVNIEEEGLEGKCVL